MAGGHPIARGIAILCTIVGVFFLAVLLLTVGSDGQLGSVLALADRVGVVAVEGVIGESDEVVAALKRFERSDAVKAVVVRIESPGGGVAPAQEIAGAIRRLRRVKPVVASLGGVAASGGYYVASACDAIVANPGTITGSIGVIVELGNVEELLEKIGLRAEVLKAGEYKDMGSPLRPLTAAERALFQEMIDSVHAQFITAVAEGRALDLDAVRRLADGRIFSGEQAKAAGLVDVLGGLEDAVRLAADRGGIVGEPRVNRARPGRPAWWRLLREMVPVRLPGTRPVPGLQLLYGGPFLR